MKILKYLLGGLAALAILFILIGVFQPEIHYTTTISVNKSAAEAFAVFRDESKTKDWLINWVSSEPVKGTPNEVGSQHKITMNYQGNPFEMLETIKIYQPGEQYAMHLDSDMLAMDIDIRFQPEGTNKTVITAENTIKGKGMIMRSIMALSKSATAEEDQQNYDRLKQLIEEG